MIGLPLARVGQVKIQMTILAGRNGRRIVGQRRGDVVDGFRGNRIGHQVRAVGRQIARVSRRDQRPRNELRRASRRHEIRQNLVVAGLRKRHIDGPFAIRALLRDGCAGSTPCPG